jgi:NitT/TauT family transport system substrate-binding protein
MTIFRSPGFKLHGFNPPGFNSPGSNPRIPGHPSLSRRAILRTLGIAAPLGLVGPHVFASNRPTMPAVGLAAPPICRSAAEVPVTVPTGAPRKLKITWNASAICTAGIPVAQAKGYFAKRNLDVELTNFGGSTDQLLEAIATGKADAGVGMALRWLKPLEQGFDVRITTATHGGCMRLLAAANGGIEKLEDLKGKSIGVSDMAAPDKNFFAIRLARLGIDPTSDVEFRAYPADLLPVALQKGEVQAFTLGDPLGWVIRDRDGLKQVATNLDGDYAHRACCVLGVRGSLIRDDRATAAALTEAVLEAQEFVLANPEETARIFAPNSPVAKPEQLAEMLRSHTHGHHPMGSDLKQEIALYIEELKGISVIKPSTNSAKFADKVYANVLS